MADAALCLLKSVTREGVEFRRAVGLAADGANQVRTFRTCFAFVGATCNLGQILTAGEVDLSLSLR
jgi:hypothetical protein